MAIKITTDVVTDKGITTELYVMVDMVEYIKSESRVIANIKTYFSQADRQESENKTCKTFVIKPNYSYYYNIDNLNDNAYTYVYQILSDQLSLEHTVTQI
tara:strand:- start:745 stop:1044 length:300 start_codon:yes stop_codon:yes gene_type:complete